MLFLSSTIPRRPGRDGGALAAQRRSTSVNIAQLNRQSRVQCDEGDEWSHRPEDEVEHCLVDEEVDAVGT